MSVAGVSAIGQAFAGILKGFDGLFTSDEERLTGKGLLMNIQSIVMSTILDYEQRIAELQSSIINTEAKGESWLQRNWRPMTMLFFVGLVGARWMGLTTEVTPELELELMGLIKIGLGGYVVGRSAEKIVKAVDFGKIFAKESKRGK